jgi:hypothetical protein
LHAAFLAWKGFDVLHVLVCQQVLAYLRRFKVLSTGDSQQRPTSAAAAGRGGPASDDDDSSTEEDGGQVRKNVT